MLKSSQYSVDKEGYYGKYGGSYIPEMLYPNVDYLAKNYLTIIEDEEFQKEYHYLLKHYVGRPTPLYYAERLSEKYSAKILLKREDLCHTGAHKINNAVGQILLAKKIGKKRIIAETGAGQHGVATATVCALKNIECVVYMGAKDIERQKPNVARMKLLGAKVVPVYSGSSTLKDATNEAIRDWVNNPEGTHYIIGSVVGPHPYPDMVAHLQSIIGYETKRQLSEYYNVSLPNYLMACVGGGSNAAGLFYPFLEEESVRLIAAEAGGKGVETSQTAATTMVGKMGILHGSKTILMQDENGQVIEPYSISAGLDYPGIGPLHSYLYETKRATFLPVNDDEALEAVKELAELEGIIQALETAHITACLKKMNFKKEDIVVLGLSGRGDKDLQTYIKHFEQE